MSNKVWVFVIAIAILVACSGILAGFQKSAAPSRDNPGSSLPENVSVKKPLHERNAGEIAAAFIGNDRNLTGYSATIHTTGESGYEDDEYLFSAERPDRFRAEYIRSGIHGNGTIVLANGTFVWQYHPDTGKAQPDLIGDPDNTFFAQKDYPAIAARILEKFPAVLNGTENRNGSTVVTLESAINGTSTDYYPAIFSRIRVGIDEKTLLVTRLELIGEYNQTVFTAEIRNITVNPGFPQGTFDFIPPAGTEVSPGIAELLAPQNLSSMYQAKVRFGPDFLVPAYLPEGYTFRYCLHYLDRDGRDSLVYSGRSGDLVFTLALQEDNTSFAQPEGEKTVLPVGNRSGTSWSGPEGNHLRWNEGNMTCELDGTLPGDELARIAGSVKAPGLLNFAPDEIGNPEEIERIALKDPSAKRMVESGGEILGVGMSVKRGLRDSPGGVFPALLVRYNGLMVDYMVDPGTGKSVGRTVQVPNGAEVLGEGNSTVVRYRGEILFTFDPLEGTP
ncbi:MAG: DUF4367 domain-containing protein [Methanoregulaceae archaeon]